MSHTCLKIAIILVVLSAAYNAHAQTVFTGKPQYQIEVHRADTVMGKIIVEMFPAIAPNSVANWDSLVAIHFYDSTAFHRVIPGFMIQGGDPNSRSGAKSTWGYGDPSQTTVDAEFSAVSHRRGILSAARSNDTNSATSQFFICVGNPTYLDRKYSVYGHVVTGMNVADSIVNAPRDANDDPLVKITMFITKLGSNDSLEPAPSLVSPVDGTTTAISNVQLKWAKVSDAMMYELQMADDPGFTNILLDSTLNQTVLVDRVTVPNIGKTYYWRVLANNGGHASPYSSAWKYTVSGSGVKSSSDNLLSLTDPTPNPSNGKTTISYSLSQDGAVRITASDVLGRVITVLEDARSVANGNHELTIPAGKLLPGAYLIKLESNGTSITKRLVIE